MPQAAKRGRRCGSIRKRRASDRNSGLIELDDGDRSNIYAIAVDRLAAKERENMHVSTLIRGRSISVNERLLGPRLQTEIVGPATQGNELAANYFVMEHSRPPRIVVGMSRRRSSNPLKFNALRLR
jgi:hypothetical protein